MAASTSIFAAPALANTGAKHGVHKTHKGFGGSVFAKKKRAAFAKKKVAVKKKSVFHAPVRKARHSKGFRQSVFLTKKLKLDALQTCNHALRVDAKKFGYHGARFVDTDIKQIGKG